MTAVRPPAELDHIVSAIGAEATLALIEAHGGVRIKVPVIAAEGRALAEVIGVEALRGLCGAFGGNHLKVPLAKGWRVLILRTRDGLSVAEIARRLQMAENAVYRHLHAASRHSGARGSAGVAGNQPRLPGFG